MSDFFWPVRVYYEDTDSGGVVYYANYLRFMERARTERLRSIGIHQQTLRHEQGVVFAVRSAQLEFLKPAHLDDALTVSARITEQRRASLVFEQNVVRDAGGELLCSGRFKVACLDARTLRPAPIPEQIMQELQSGH